MPGRTLTVLGCDGSYPGPGGAASGYLVRCGTTTVWLDAGPGTFANLQLLDDPASVDAIVLSHEHPDHWTDIESFAVWARHGRGARRGPGVPVYAPPGLRQRAYHAEDAALDWHEIGPSYRIGVGELLLGFVATDHGPPTLAARIEVPAASEAPALAYSADTGPDWSVAELGAGIGTFLCEATVTASSEGTGLRHLSARQAGTMAREAGVGRLLLTHRWPTVSVDASSAEAADAFGAPADPVRIGDVVEW